MLLASFRFLAFAFARASKAVASLRLQRGFLFGVDGVDGTFDSRRARVSFDAFAIITKSPFIVGFGDKNTSVDKLRHSWLRDSAECLSNFARGHPNTHNQC